MKAWLLIVGLALTGFALRGCTSRSGDASTAPKARDEAPLNEREALLTDWKRALARTLESQQRADWKTVENATAWEWPEFQDYRLFYRARAFDSSGRFTEATDLYAKVAADAPRSLFFDEAQTRRYLTAARLGATPEIISAAESWTREARSIAGRVDRLLVLSTLYESAGRVTDAVGVYRRMYIEYAAHAAASEAERRMERLGASPTPLSYEELDTRAEALYAGRAYDSAFKAYGELVGRADTNSDKQTFLLQQALTRFHRRAYDAARKLFQSAQALAPESDSGIQARYYEAYANSRLGRPERAVEIYSSVAEPIKLRKTTWAEQAQFKLGLVHLQEGDDDKAILHFKRYLDRFGQSPQRALAEWWLAWAYYNRGSFAEARDAFEARAKYGDETARAALYWMGRCEEKLGRKEKADEIMDRIVAKMPLHYYAQLASVRSKRPITATPERRRFFEPDGALEIDSSAVYHLRRGEVLAEIGRADEAEREYRKAAQSTSSRDPVIAAARALVGIGRYNAAQRMVWANFEPELLSDNAIYTDLWELAYPRAFAAIVNAKAAEYGTHPHIVLALMREESRYRPDVMSPANAYGLLQLIMPTARRVAARLGMPAPTTQDLYDPEVNITLGTAYISSLLNAYRNNLFLAFAGYNGGPVNVNRWLAQRSGSELDEFVENIPYTETRNYVKKVTTSLLRYQYLYEPDTAVAMAFLSAAVHDTDRADGVR